MLRKKFLNKINNFKMNYIKSINNYIKILFMNLSYPCIFIKFLTLVISF